MVSAILGALLVSWSGGDCGKDLLPDGTACPLTPEEPVGILMIVVMGEDIMNCRLFIDRNSVENLLVELNGRLQDKVVSSLFSSLSRSGVY